MATISIRHRVGDLDKWKEVFEEFSPQRKAGGEISYSVGHLPEDPLDIHLFFEWDSVENAEKFMTSHKLLLAMMDATVVEKPQIVISKKLFGGRV